MREHDPRPFVEAILGATYPQIEDPRFEKLIDGDPIAVPARRRADGQGGLLPAAPLSLGAARAVHALFTGADVRFADGADAALALHGQITSLVYRTGANSVTSTGSTPYPASAAILFAARLLLEPGADDFAEAALTFARGLADKKAKQPALDEMLRTAADELVVALTIDLSVDDVAWRSGAKKDEEPALRDAAALPLAPLFADPAGLAAHREGKGDFTTVGVRLSGAVADDGTTVEIDTTNFFGPQLDLTVRYMGAGRHILHHGPTGTGKSFVWELAMKRLDPAFDANLYGYFVHGSAGLEDIDLIGNYVLRADGAREWVDGALVRAMKEGKRLKVEELNRMSASHLNVLLGAMDYGRITLSRYDGQIVVAKEGFAVDAMANIGSEYTGTEEIDPAVMRRFAIKIEYDFLKPADEVALLRSRTGIGNRDAEVLVRIANSIRDGYRTGSGIDVDLYVSPAALLNSAALVAEGASIAEAIEHTWIAEVAKTSERRAAVRETITAHLPRGKKPR
jgi:MoxR-like ATPase